jgi:hypothetical protein
MQFPCLFSSFGKVRLLSGVASTLLLASQGAGAASLFAAVDDRELNETSPLTLGLVDGATFRAGASTGAAGRNGIFMFQLPDLGAVAAPFASADLGLYLFSPSSTPAYNVDLYGLGVQSSSALVLGSGVLATNRYYEGAAADANATLIQLDFATPAMGFTPGWRNTNSTGDTNLVSYLNSVYANGTNIGQYVFFRVNPDVSGGEFTGYNFSSADTGTTAGSVGAGTTFDPVITYTSVPEPSTVITLLGGVAALGILRRARR